jgi:hypothetical protein
MRWIDRHLKLSLALHTLLVCVCLATAAALMR